MERRKISRPNYGVGRNGVKRIARNRNIEESYSSNKHINKLIRKVDNVENTIIVVFDCQKSIVTPESKELLLVAQALASENTAVLAVIFGEADISDVKKGADRVLMLDDEVWQQYNNQPKIDIILSIIEKENIARIIFSEDSFGGELARMLAVKTGLSYAGNVDEISKEEVTRICVNQSKQQTYKLPTILSLLPKTTEGEVEFDCEAIPYEISLDKPEEINQVESQISANEIDIDDADFICSAGNGIKDFEQFDKFANTLGASIGASRVVVDNGNFPYERQVGATGTIVRSSIYIATGISGAIQHLQGITQCARVLAINTDENCAMIKRANLSIIHDAQEIMQEVVKELAND